MNVGLRKGQSAWSTDGMISWRGATLLLHLLMHQCQWCVQAFDDKFLLGRHNRVHFPGGSCATFNGARQGLDRPLPQQSFRDAGARILDNGNSDVDYDDECMVDSGTPEAYDSSAELFRLFLSSNNGAGISRTCIDEILR